MFFLTQIYVSSKNIGGGNPCGNGKICVPLHPLLTIKQSIKTKNNEKNFIFNDGFDAVGSNIHIMFVR